LQLRNLLTVFAVLSVIMSCDKSTEPEPWVADTPEYSFFVPGLVKQLRITPDGKYIITGHSPTPLTFECTFCAEYVPPEEFYPVGVWQLTDGSLVNDLHNSSGIALTTVPDSDLALVMGGGSSTEGDPCYGTAVFSVVNPLDGGHIRCFAGSAFEKGPIALTTTSDGIRVISSTWDGTLELWDFATGDLIRSLEWYRSNTLVTTHDDTHVVAAGYGSIGVIRLSDGERIRQVPTSAPFDHTPVALTTDGIHVVSPSSEGEEINIWELTTGTTVKTLRGHTSGITGLTVTPDGEHLVSCAVDNTIRVWSLATGDVVQIIRGSEGSMFLHIVVTLDGQHVVTGDSKRVISMWALNI
jgi:WD40 repeat protein